MVAIATTISIQIMASARHARMDQALMALMEMELVLALLPIATVIAQELLVLVVIITGIGALTKILIGVLKWARMPKGMAL